MSKKEARNLIKQIMKENPEMIVDFVEAHADFTNNLIYELKRETAKKILTKPKQL